MNLSAERTRLISILQGRASIQLFEGGLASEPSKIIEEEVKKAVSAFEEALRRRGFEPSAIHIAKRLFAYNSILRNLVGVLDSTETVVALDALAEELLNKVFAQPEPTRHLRLVK